jgi:hypothetical protein
MHEWVKRKCRFPVEVDVIIFRDEGRKSTARLTDLSDQGCKIESQIPFCVDERVQIAIPRMGMIKAQIQWTAAGKAGAKFVIETDF